MTRRKSITVLPPLIYNTGNAVENYTRRVPFAYVLEIGLTAAITRSSKTGASM
ncbi:MAG TPA: hypothetical protein VKM55_12500 [Candidatus Lokiarchaeia archaeon]|nr:hypothetical protein [Candidatus Lokiarchaeia archaeon]